VYALLLTTTAATTNHPYCPTPQTQVVDARDPLTYFSQDLVSYAREQHATKSSFVLLNKADLLPAAVRAAWADYFDARGIRYGFWSAFAASEAQARARHDAIAVGLAAPAPAEVAAYFRQLLGLSSGSSSSSDSSRTRILSVDELLEVFEREARAAVDAAGEDDPRRCGFLLCSW
jgi:large subunit GTPase 1